MWRSSRRGIRPPPPPAAGNPTGSWPDSATVRSAADSGRLAEQFADPATRYAVHALGEAGEQVAAVVRAGAGLGVVLHAEGVGVAGGEALAHAVVEVDVGEVGDAGQRVDGDGEVVVLARDLDVAGREVLDRVVGAVVAERQLDRRRRRAPGPAAGCRGRCRRSGCPCRAARRGSPVAPATSAGSPGPLDRKTPSGSRATTSAAGVDAGTTSTVPSPARLRRIVRLMP